MPQDSTAAARIRRAATEAFGEQGYGGTSTRDITRRLGLSAAALYPHYPSKEELLYAISLDGHRAALAVLRAADDPAAPPAARLRAVVAAFTAWQARQSTLARVVQYEIRALSPEHYRTVVAIRHETSAVLAAIIEAGRAAGDFTVPDPAGALLAISSLCVDVCRWFPAGAHDDPDRLAALYADLAARMLA
ncbi:TetR/AcrR family transcriptional regulator [Actinomadura parmotrematis]|uniref:TetR/AcrR family transcriptional regulator n=1 Tax=Actinomadura parmotrematis TaxID=2864039 RepID=A0ABS7FMS7_9ACTN|nr:TetR/AcrR family transcriptional regulator [Actinomadura parmotrematis]MBW8481685.1 TetR/AcrR family transcriptional regulator [Actinomadura parmotrematis]